MSNPYPDLNFTGPDCLDMITSVFTRDWDLRLVYPIELLIKEASINQITFSKACENLISQSNNTHRVVLLLASYQYLMNKSKNGTAKAQETIAQCKKQLDFLARNETISAKDKATLEEYYDSKIKSLQWAVKPGASISQSNHSPIIDVERIEKRTLKNKQ